MQDRTRQRPPMPDRVQIRHFLDDVEDGTEGVGQAAGDKQPEASGWQHLDDTPDAEDDRPAHDRIDDDTHPLGSKHPERLAGDADQREYPDEDKQADAAVSAQRDQAKRRVGTRDQQIDGRVVKDLEDIFGARIGQAVVERRGHILEDHGNAVNERGGQLIAVKDRPDRKDREQHKRRHAEQRAKAVQDAGGDLLAHRVLLDGGALFKYTLPAEFFCGGGAGVSHTLKIHSFTKSHPL